MPRSVKKGPFIDDHLMKKVEAAASSGDRKVIKTREAILQSPEFKALWDRARLYNQLKNTPKAIEDYTNLLMKFPNVTKAVGELFKIYMAEKNKVLAQKLLINHLQRTRSKHLHSREQFIMIQIFSKLNSRT